MIRMTRSDRPYRGVEAAERLATRRRQSLSAGLDLLGSDQHDIAELTIRTICRRAGLSVRYFYESFTDKDEFVGRVFDWVVAELVATTQAAVTAVPAREQTRAGMANIVRTITADARVGRLLFSTQLANAVITRKRAESSACSPCCPANMPSTPCTHRQMTTSRRSHTSPSAASGRPSAPGWPVTCDSIPTSWSIS